jgi:GntR family transcriptional repressor for pyruvate dehydrogenase complex
MLVAQRIVRDLANDKLKPGSSLPPERSMLVQYEIGRGTLREALRLLEFQGVIALKPGPGGGPVLLRPDAGHLGATLVLLMQLAEAPFRVIVEARAALEPMISRLAAERIGEDGLLELRATVDQMATGIDDQVTFLEANKQFHDIIARSSGNAMFSYVIESLLGILDGTVLGIDYPAHRRAAILKAHEEIFTALANKDAPASESRMREHIDAYVRFAERRYPQVLDRVMGWHEFTP